MQKEVVHDSEDDEEDYASENCKQTKKQYPSQLKTLAMQI